MGRPKGSTNKLKITPETVPSTEVAPLKITAETVPTISASPAVVVQSLTPLWDCFPENKPVEEVLTQEQIDERDRVVAAAARMREQAHTDRNEVALKIPGASQWQIFINPPENYDIEKEFVVPEIIAKDHQGWGPV